MTEDEVAKLYARYGYVVFRRCLAYLGDPAAARDAVQSVFVHVVRAGQPAATQPVAEVDPRTALSRIADQLCCDLLRSSEFTAGAQAAQSELEAAVAHDDTESLLAVRRLAAGLDPDTLRLAVLYFVDELTEEELARELALSRRVLSKRLQLLMDRTRALLQPEGAA
jgi:RNA polymerase sigma-70 factor (ECF subfamily)